MWQFLNKPLVHFLKMSGENKRDNLGWFGFSLLFFIFGLTAVVWLNNGWAAMAPASAVLDAPTLSPLVSKSDCPVKIRQLFLAGDFTMPSNGERMQVRVGMVHGGKQVSAVISNLKSLDSCEATCRVERLERYAKDRQPALLEMECEGRGLKALRSPLHIQWARQEQPRIRVGSALYGVEEAPLLVEVNRYAAPHKVASMK